MCQQDLKDSAVGALQQWVPPDARKTLAGSAVLATMDEEGWITLSAQCERHLSAHYVHLLAHDTPDHVRRISIEKYLSVEAEHGNFPEEREIDNGHILREQDE